MREAPPSLFKLARKPAGNWLELKLEGVKANRSGIGALVRMTAGGVTQTRTVRSGGSYISQNDLRLHFGLGEATQAGRIEILWPGGNRQVVDNLEANQIVTIRERDGQVNAGLEPSNSAGQPQPVPARDPRTGRSEGMHP